MSQILADSPITGSDQDKSKHLSKAERYAHLPYRDCVGIALFNAAGKVFVGERIDTPGAWQMPQGGIDSGETAEEAALRELAEETGTDKAQLITAIDNWLTYDLPDHLLGVQWDGQYKGQRQLWYAARFQGRDSDINIETEIPEFKAWQWVDLGDIPDLAVPFKRHVYEEIVHAFTRFATPKPYRAD